MIDGPGWACQTSH